MFKGAIGLEPFCGSAVQRYRYLVPLMPRFWMRMFNVRLVPLVETEL
jgi:hypothetical protein